MRRFRPAIEQPGYVVWDDGQRPLFTALLSAVDVKLAGLEEASSS